jgi:triosephosphate isomerase|tara:strand:- start:144 stop:887 length:744 start_codon:yes stop_codon:yes gene_type:complete
MRKIIAGNWKMNGKLENLLEIKKISNEFARSKIEIIICPPFTLLSAASEIAKNVYLGAQNLHPESEGAFTGEISADMLVDLGVKYSIIGHSERRNEHNETNEIVARKVKISLEKNLQTIICIGETELQRKENSTLEILEQQLLESLANNTNSEKLIVAYEPIWAIGTGLIPEVSEISKIHDFLRVRLVELYGSNASTIPLLYGGSVNGSNASEIFNVNNVNGALVGGASLSFEKFAPIIRAIENTGP